MFFFRSTTSSEFSQIQPLNWNWIGLVCQILFRIKFVDNEKHKWNEFSFGSLQSCLMRTSSLENTFPLVSADHSFSFGLFFLFTTILLLFHMKWLFPDYYLDVFNTSFLFYIFSPHNIQFFFSHPKYGVTPKQRAFKFRFYTWNFGLNIISELSCFTRHFPLFFNCFRFFFSAIG